MRGPNTDPWGTPAETGSKLDQEYLLITFCLLLKTVINHDLLELNAWSSKWLMSFNPEKTEILFFSDTGNIDNIKFSFPDFISVFKKEANVD
jgi:hypothetical protein